ncbi:hypothetical protein [Novosphingobium terrae]|uniref:hypothetical protein n=1 Tax=Novosphingobium terrae TaxID=2726189 RepID=UPI00198095CC|nr:hypothetical protein [Novosphingobium terrae]
MQAAPPAPVVTQEIRVTDAQGHARIVLSARDGTPTIQLLRGDDTPGATISLDAAGRPAIRLANPAPNAPTASLEIDDKGAHVKFDRPGGASSYVFLNNAGGSGIVLIDARGARKAGIVLAPDGTISLQGITPTP